MVIKPNTKIKDMSIEEKIVLVIKSDGCLVDLLENCVIDHSLYLNDLNKLTHTPKNLEVIGYLNMNNCANLEIIESGLMVRGSLVLHNCVNLEEISNDLDVGGNLFLGNCNKLKEIPNVRVRGKINLPEHLKGK